MKHLSLFSGIGGFDLAAEWMGWENVAHCEIDPFCRKILNYYWPNATTHENIINTDFSIYRGRIDIITGGFPCQPFSVAGTRKGTNDHRYLWPEYLRAIREIKPAFVVAENVTGILTMEEREVFFRVDSKKRIRFDYIDEYEAVYTRQASLLLHTICEDLEQEGYTVQPFIIPAAGIGAPHRRDRIWIIAYAGSEGHGRAWNGYPQDRSAESCGKKEQKKRERVRSKPGGINDPGITSNTIGGGCKTWVRTGNESNTEAEAEETRTESERHGSDGNATDTNKLNGYGPGFYTGAIPQQGQAEILGSADSNANRSGREKLHNPDLSERSGYNSRFHFPEPENWDGFPTQSPVCDGNDGLSAKLDGITFSHWRNKSVESGGNAVVPPLVYEIFKSIEAFRNEIN